MDVNLDNLLVIFLLLVNGGLGNTVQITLAALGDPSATLLLVNLNNANLLEGLEDAAVDLAGGVDVVGGAGTAVLGGSVDLAETTDTDSLAEVDVTSDSSGANVEPITIRNYTRSVRGIWTYQSASWGGSSLEAEVLTVSTQPAQVRLYS